MAVHIAEMVCAGQLADEREVRLARIVEMQEKRQNHAGGDAKFNSKAKRYDDGRCHGCEIRLGIFPDFEDFRNVDQRKHCDDDCRREDRLRQVEYVGR